MKQTESLQLQLNQVQIRSLIVGGVGLLFCLLGAFFSLEQFFRSYLFAYLFWLGIALGCFAIALLHHLVGGAWGFPIRRTLEAGALTLPLMALLFVPLIFGLTDLYIWARPEEVAADKYLQHKSAYLNVPFFLARAVFYFVLWIGIAYGVSRWSHRQDNDPNPGRGRRLRILSAVGLLLYTLTVTFASVDWAMSLEPHWFSTIYGILFAVGQILAALALAIIAVILLSSRKPLVDFVTPGHFHDLGNLLLAFVMIWAYIAFSQYMIIWSANLPDEITWYLRRMEGGWEWIAMSLILFHFALPFMVLLSRYSKRRTRILMSVAVALFFMHLLDVFWLVVPAFYTTGLYVHWLDIAAAIGIGGLWGAAFIWQLKSRPLLPAHIPRTQEAPKHV